MPGGRRFPSLDDLDVVDAAAAIPRRSWGAASRCPSMRCSESRTFCMR